MGKVTDIGDYFEDEPDVGSMKKDELLAYLREIKARIAELNTREPRDMDSPEYESWGDLHEELEDLMDDVLDRLDELK